MTTLGEIAWAGLISRKNTFRSLFSGTDYVYVRFAIGWEEIMTEEQEFSSFILPKVTTFFPNHELRAPTVYLCLKAYDTEGNSTTKQFLMKWPSLPLSGGRRLFHPRAKHIKIRFPIPDPLIMMHKRPRNSVTPASSNQWVPVELNRSTQLARSTRSAATSVLALVRQRHLEAQAKQRPSFVERSTNGLTSRNFPFSFSRTNPVVDSTGFMNLEVAYRNASYVATPNFRTLSKADQKRSLPILPYSLDVRKTLPGQAWQRVEAVNDGTVLFDAMPLIGGFISVPSGPLVLDPECNAKALRRLQNSTGVDLSNAAVTIVQWKQLDSLLSGNAMKLVRSVNAVRKGRFAEAEKILFHGASPRYRQHGGPSRTKSLASNWLELQYGWKPLLSDIQGILEAHSRYIARDASVIAVRGSASTRRVSVTSIQGPLKWSLATVNPYACGTIETLVEHRCRYGLAYQLEDANKAFLAQTGFTNPVNLAWELIPFSFVADWFLPIGPYLESFNHFKGMRFMGGHKSYSVRETILCTVRDTRLAGSGAQVVNITNAGQGTRHRYMFRREVLTDFPNPEPPAFKNPISLIHSVNALALIASSFRN